MIKLTKGRCFCTVQLMAIVAKRLEELKK